MPEHEGVRFIEYSGAAEILSAMGGDDYMALNGSDARDLITMHALRWASALEAPRHSPSDYIVDRPSTDFIGPGISRKTYKELQGGQEEWKPKLLTWPVYTLEDVLVATAFLEPGEGKHPGSKGS